MLRLKFVSKLFALSLFIILLTLLRKLMQKDTNVSEIYMAPEEETKISLRESLRLYEEQKCVRQEKIYFLKTSKTGSTTIQNILLRLGLRANGTNFLFGENGNGGMFLDFSYMPFSVESCFLGSFGIKNNFFS